MEFVYIPQNVCSRELHIEYEGNKIVSFYAVGGCHGNLQAVGKLLEGMDIDEAISRLSGIVCRGSRNRMTSCGDQLANALKTLQESRKQQ